MPLCVVCGKEADSCICESCRNKEDIEKLSMDIIRYNPGFGGNELWDSIAGQMTYTSNFKNIVFSLTAELPSPRKEYIRILCVSGDGANVPKASRPWLYEVYEVLKKTPGLTTDEKNRIRGILLGALYMDYRYEEADTLAGRLLEQERLPVKAYYNLADFFLKTRRYDEAADAIGTARDNYGNEPGVAAELTKLSEQNEKYREAEANGKKEYMPNPKEDKDAVRKAYVDFLASIGIEAEPPATSTERKSRYPKPIPKDQYPKVQEKREADFDTFVAYDVETTGRQTTIDSIIEIAAVRVVNGEVKETAEFTFQELVKPFKRSVRPEIVELTGITKEDVSGARQMWEVTPDFVKFIGDDILVGYNNIRFDSKFLARAGRYSQIVIDNLQFDAMRYALSIKDKLRLGEKFSLEVLTEKLEISNPRAHRALADAITTAKVYLKLKEIGVGDAGAEIDDILADLDEW